MYCIIKHVYNVHTKFGGALGAPCSVCSVLCLCARILFFPALHPPPQNFNLGEQGCIGCSLAGPPLTVSRRRVTLYGICSLIDVPEGEIQVRRRRSVPLGPLLAIASRDVHSATGLKWLLGLLLRIQPN